MWRRVFRLDRLAPVLILVIVLVTRLVGISWAPPIINQDEASNAYDAYCLLNTGADRWGAGWPLTVHAFGEGDNRPALYSYLVIPFIAAFGLGDATSVAVRLPAVLGSVLMVGFFYGIVRRTCGSRTAFWAGLLVSLSPWYFQLSRLGLECALTPIFLPLALYCLSRAGWPLLGLNDSSPGEIELHRGWMAAAGAAVAMAPYAYASQRAFMPLMMIAGLLIYRREVFHFLKRGSGRASLIAGLAGFAVVVAPLAWSAMTDWSTLMNRAGHVSLFHSGKPFSEALAVAGRQYLEHYGPRWLFWEGDYSLMRCIPQVGQLHRSTIPLLLLGLTFILIKRKRLHLLILAWLLLYPAASAPTRGAPQAFRAAVGIGAFEWVTALGLSWLIGGVSAWTANPSKAMILRAGIYCTFGLLLLRDTAMTMRQYFVVFAQSPRIRAIYQNDLCDVAMFLRHRWRDYDRIFVSDRMDPSKDWFSNQPYIYFLTYLPVDHEEFSRWPKKIFYAEPNEGYEIVETMGPFTFSTRPEVLENYFRNHAGERVLIFARPGDITNVGIPIIHSIQDRFGRTRFDVLEIDP